MMTRYIVGIDYSLNSPAVCVCEGAVDIKNCTFFAFEQLKKHSNVKHNQIILIPKKEEKGMMRYDRNANLVLIAVDHLSDMMVGIEGYSFGSVSSSTFDIGENTGILKHVLAKNKNIECVAIAPTTIKKSATSKGNAKKEQMYEAWLEQGGFDLLSVFDAKSPDSNPISDIVDSYFVMKAFSEIKLK